MNINEQLTRMKNMMGIDEVSDDTYNEIKTKYSNARLIMSDNSEIQYRATPNQEISFKPKGLWYGIGDEWIKWVRSEMPDWESDNVFKIDIDETKILKITNYEELVEFEQKYTAIRQVDRTDFRPSAMMASMHPSIDWVKVANEYGGVEIAPYIYEARYEHRWYYGWDVASGCIWGDGVITNILKLNV
jgi:hypothetical protein